MPNHVLNLILREELRYTCTLNVEQMSHNKDLYDTQKVHLMIMQLSQLDIAWIMNNHYDTLTGLLSAM